MTGFVCIYAWRDLKIGKVGLFEDERIYINVGYYYDNIFQYWFSKQIPVSIYMCKVQCYEILKLLSTLYDWTLDNIVMCSNGHQLK